MADFDRHAEDYAATVNRAIGGVGPEHDFFVTTKARLLFERIEDRLGDPATVRALDIGCGIGALDRLLVERVASLDGVDVSADSVQRAQQAVPKGRFQVYDGTTLPFADGGFDFALAVCVLHHVPPDRWPAFVAEMARVLRPGGLAAIIEHNPYNPLTRRVVNRCPFDADAVLLPGARSQALFAGSAFQAVETRYFTFLPFRGAWVGAVERWIGWLPLGAQYCVTAVRR